MTKALNINIQCILACGEQIHVTQLMSYDESLTGYSDFDIHNEGFSLSPGSFHCRSQSTAGVLCRIWTHQES